MVPVYEVQRVEMVTTMILVGIDPGLNGGIAIDGPMGVMALPMPTKLKTVNRRQRTRYDMLALRDKFQTIARMEDGPENIRCFIEQQNPMGAKGRGAIGAFMSGQSYGQIIGMLWGLRIPYKAVLAQTWQRALSIPKFQEYEDRKRYSVTLANEFFPDVSLMRTAKCTKGHDGMAEALLLLAYGRRFMRELV